MSINATLFIQAIVFLILVWFTMKFVWPPIAKALDERAQKIAEGLAAADRAKSELTAANQRVEKELSQEEAKARATEEGNKIVASARAEAEQQTVQAREALREQVAALAVKGAEQILRKEVNAGVHADLLNRLKTEL